VQRDISEIADNNLRRMKLALKNRKRVNVDICHLRNSHGGCRSSVGANDKPIQMDFKGKEQKDRPLIQTDLQFYLRNLY
jgi:hypothetical protein